MSQAEDPNRLTRSEEGEHQVTTEDVRQLMGEIARLQRLGFEGETRGEGAELGERPLPSLDLAS